MLPDDEPLCFVTVCFWGSSVIPACAGMTSPKSQMSQSTSFRPACLLRQPALSGSHVRATAHCNLSVHVLAKQNPIFPGNFINPPRFNRSRIMLSVFLRQILLSVAMLNCALFVVGCGGNSIGAAGTCNNGCEPVNANEVACPYHPMTKVCTEGSSNCTGGGPDAPCSCRDKPVGGEDVRCYCSK